MTVRPPAVAGLYYPADLATLAGFVNDCFDEVEESDGPRAKALVVPHSGIVWSGRLLAEAFARVDPRVSHVVVIGPAHHVEVTGIVPCTADGMATVMGVVPLTSPDELFRLAGVHEDEEVHRREHAIEVPLPFLQNVLPFFDLLAVAVGQAEVGDVEAFLDAVWGGPETLVVVSSDLSRLCTAETARERDAGTLARIGRLESPLAPEQACASVVVDALMRVAARRGMSAEVLGQGATQAGVSGQGLVVGFGAVVVCEQ